MKKALFILLFCVNLFGADIHIAVAANMSYVIEALKKSFEKKYPQINIKITLGSSGKLTSQIKHGAPYDIFMSANMEYPNALYKDGFTLSKAIIYAEGSLVLFSRKKRDLSKGIHTLLASDIQRVAIGNPKTAPYGKAAKEALQNAKIYTQVKEKLIYGESISQTLTYALRATEVGIIAKSSLFAKSMSQFREQQNWVNINKELYTPIAQGIVLLKRARQKNQAELFYQFILSSKAKKIFNKFGYTTL